MNFDIYFNLVYLYLRSANRTNMFNNEKKTAINLNYDYSYLNIILEIPKKKPFKQNKLLIFCLRHGGYCEVISKPYDIYKS